MTAVHAGGCLCGAVRYRIEGPMRDVLICHCGECQRWHGSVCAATRVRLDQLSFAERRGLRWVDSPASQSHARRGFCGQCGSSLFWQAPGLDTISIAAGTLDRPTGLRLLGHIHTATAGDYYQLPADGLPRHRGGWPE